MDPRQHHPSQPPPQSTSTTHLKPPPSHHTQQRAPPSPSQPHHHHRTPITAHPSATISESLLIQGSHPISIGASTIIHPRARIYSYEGPVIIGNGCIISEKSVIGSAPTTATSTTSTSTSSGIASKDEGSILPIRISNSVTIGPGAQILPGAHIHSASCVEARAVIGRRAVVGSHCRVCAGVEVADGDGVADWMVVWGGGNRRRRRAVGRVEPSKVVFPAGAGGGGNGIGGNGLEGRVIEEARLMVLQRERDALVRLIGGRRR